MKVLNGVSGANPLAVLLSRRPSKARYQESTEAIPGRSCTDCKRRHVGLPRRLAVLLAWRVGGSRGDLRELGGRKAMPVRCSSVSCPCGSTVPRYGFTTGWWCLICHATEPTWAPFLARLVAGQQVADAAEIAEFGRLRRSVEAPRAKHGE